MRFPAGLLHKLSCMLSVLADDSCMQLQSFARALAFWPETVLGSVWTLQILEKKRTIRHHNGSLCTQKQPKVAALDNNQQR